MPKAVSITSSTMNRGNYSFQQMLKASRIANFLKDLGTFEGILNDNLYTFSCAVRQFTLPLGKIDTELFIGFLGSQQEWDHRVCKPNRVKETKRGCKKQDHTFKMKMYNILYYKKSNDTGDGFPQLISTNWSQKIKMVDTQIENSMRLNVLEYDSVEFYINLVTGHVDAEVELKNYTPITEYDEINNKLKIIETILR